MNLGTKLGLETTCLPCHVDLPTPNSGVCHHLRRNPLFGNFDANGGKRHYSVWVGRHDMAGRSFLDLIWSLDSYFGALKAPRAVLKQYILSLGQIWPFSASLWIYGGEEAAVWVVSCRHPPRRPP